MTRGVFQYCGRVCTHVLHGHGVQDTGKALPRPLPQLEGCSQPPPLPPLPLPAVGRAGGGGGGRGWSEAHRGRRDEGHGRGKGGRGLLIIMRGTDGCLVGGLQVVTKSTVGMGMGKL